MEHTKTRYILPNDEKNDTVRLEMVRDINDVNIEVVFSNGDRELIAWFDPFGDFNLAFVTPEKRKQIPLTWDEVTGMLKVCR